MSSSIEYFTIILWPGTNDFLSQAFKHPEWRGPSLGPKPAEENRRDFNEDVLRAGQTVIGLQAGTNKMATQSGQNFGASRKIILGKWKENCYLL